ncbi:tyrosine-type recombinase/integrase [Porticoccus sp. GXU_MW_L64]
MFTYMIKKENGTCHYMRRVPNEFSEIDKRRFVKKSLKTRDPQEGLKRALLYNDIVEMQWLEKLGTTQSDPFTQYNLIKKHAEFHGYAYKPADQISDESIQNLVRRSEIASKNIDSKETVSAVYGGVDEPKLLLGECLEKYWPLCSDLLINKTDLKIKKWKNPRRSAFNYFVEIVGSDLAVQDITREHILDFEEVLRKDITNKIITGHTANKKLNFVRDVLTKVVKRYQIDIKVKLLFEDIKFIEDNKSRPSFEAEFVQETLLKSDNLENMGFEARMLVYAMSDTGARPSELIGLRQEDIILDKDIPHIWIRPYEGYTLKTKNSERIIPLVGASLYAFRRMRNGFDKSKNPDSTNTAINKFLKRHDLVPTIEHSLYSLRHTFKDRLRDITKDAELRDELMGHSNKRPDYGRGYKLSDKCELLQKIAFTPPDS